MQDAVRTLLWDGDKGAMKGGSAFSYGAPGLRSIEASLRSRRRCRSFVQNPSMDGGAWLPFVGKDWFTERWLAWLVYGRTQWTQLSLLIQAGEIPALRNRQGVELPWVYHSDCGFVIKTLYGLCRYRDSADFVKPQTLSKQTGKQRG